MTAPSAANTLANRFDFTGEVCLVSGGTRGIGLSIAETLTTLGATVVVCSRNGEEAKAVAAEIAQTCGAGGRTEGIALDVSQEEQVVAALDALMMRHGKLDCLVNNAGVSIRAPAISVSLADWNKVMDTDLTGLFLCCRHAARHMIPRGAGRMVNIGSITGFGGGRMQPNASYRAAKAGVINLTRALAVEWARHGIRVNGVAPGWVRTPMTAKLMSDKSAVDEILSLIPLGQMCEPRDIAWGVAFLLSGAARMVTGQTLVVDGGYLAQ